MSAAPGDGCRVCGRRRRRHEADGPCPSCGYEPDGRTTILEGYDGSTLGHVATAMLWAGPIAGTAAADQPWLGLLLGGVMGVHVSSKIERPSARLVLSPTGVALIRKDRRPRRTRWHLFEEVRVQPLDPRPERPRDPGPAGPGSTPADATRPAWRIVFVNAYKPSISTYLHSRGTDAAIYTPCVEFIVNATAADACDLRRQLQQRIDRSAAAYRALRLREMEEPPVDAHSALRLVRCPACLTPLPNPDAALRCGACGQRHDAAAFELEDPVLAPPSLTPVAAFVTMIAAPVLLVSGAVVAAAIAAAVALALAATALRRPLGTTVVVRSGGLELWRQGTLVGELAFIELHELTTRRLDGGRWRVACWREPRSWMHYSPLLFRWLTVPPGRPTLDLLVRGDERVAALHCAELTRRWRHARGAVAQR